MTFTASFLKRGPNMLILAFEAEILNVKADQTLSSSGKKIVLQS